MMRHPTDHDNSPIHREYDFSTRSQLALLFGIALVLMGGFLFAAWQHFAAINYGYKIEVLRREQQQLENEEKRLKLARDKAFSFSNLEPAALAIGLQHVAPAQMAITSDKQRAEKQPAAPTNPALSVAVSHH